MKDKMKNKWNVSRTSPLYVILLAMVMLMLFSTALARVRPVNDYDFDGDGKTDIVAQRLNANSNYVFYTLNSSTGFAATVWGAKIPGYTDDGAVFGDYDGDGKTDIAVVRCLLNGGDCYWYIVNSRDNTYSFVQFGTGYDSLVPQDYDGDGKTDLAFYRGGLWHIRRSSDNVTTVEQFGRTVYVPGSSDSPFPGGDYDGDGKADLAIYRSDLPLGGYTASYLYIRRSKDGTWVGYNLGDARNTALVAGDYDGDGKADVAIWQGTTWLWIRSSDNQLDGFPFGIFNNDLPIPGDYDGDGKTDVAVLRRGTRNSTTPNDTYYIQQSRDGFKAMQWGLAGVDSHPNGGKYIGSFGF